jgi:2-polyprenyl-3-methyl-5-hydroxy-6-metoxy-1,4-benzoquinol methylase
MRPEHLKYLCSPATGKPLELLNPKIEKINEIDRIKEGILSDGITQWPIVDFIPRFVPVDGYWDSFSFQWHEYPEVLHTLTSGLTAYRTRFAKETKWPEKMNDQIIIEAGCGDGTFTEIVTETEAMIISSDVSRSVDVNYKKNGNKENLLIVQASIYEMPFIKADKVFCFGVLQHTPDPKKSFFCLVNMLKPEGQIATDIYRKVSLDSSSIYKLLRTKYFLRQWTPKIKKEVLNKLIQAYVIFMWPFSMIIKKMRNGYNINQSLLLDDYASRLEGMDKKFYRQFAMLDILDMLSPEYDIPASEEEFLSWHIEANLKDIEVHPGYNGLEGRGKK